MNSIRRKAIQRHKNQNLKAKVSHAVIVSRWKFTRQTFTRYVSFWPRVNFSRDWRYCCIWMHLNFQNGKTLSVGAEMCKKSTSLFKVRDSRTADITSVHSKISLVWGSLSKVWILWCPCDYFCYISRWSSLVGGKILLPV